jgi:hypothetical protein
MRQLGKHPHAVQLVDVYEHAVVDGGRSVGTEVYLLMELCSGGSLADLMKKRPGRAVPEQQMWSTFLCPAPRHRQPHAALRSSSLTVQLPFPQRRRSRRAGAALAAAARRPPRHQG